MSVYELPKEQHPDFLDAVKKPIAGVRVARSNPISKGIISVIGDRISPLVQGASGIFKTLCTSKGLGSSLSSATSVWSAPSAAMLSGLPQSTLFVVYEQTTYNIADNGSTIYAERPNATQIYKIVQETGNVLTWVIRNAGGTGLQNQPITVAIDTSKVIHTACFVRAGDADRTLYSDGNKGTHTGSSAGTYDAATPTICLDPQDTLAGNIDSSVLAVFGFNRAITDAEYRSLDKNPFQLLEPLVPLMYAFPEEVAVGGDLLLTNRSIANYQGMRQ